MNGYFYSARIIFLGIFLSQIIATIQVYLSNTGLYRGLLAISKAGYLAIPNQEVMPSLQGFWSAFFGGLFFSLTVGAGLSLLCYAAMWVWCRPFSGNKYLAISLLLIWIGCLSVLNHKGFEPIVTSYFLFIPAVIIVTFLRWPPPKHEQKKWRPIAIFFLPLFILGALWASQATSSIFLDLRDYLLLSNRLGTKINDSYYKYTLYAAEVFKSMNQKLLKIYSIGDIRDVSLIPAIEKELAKNDYLRIDGYPSADLDIAEQDSLLTFQHQDKTIIRIMPGEFLSDPGKALKEFSLGSDRHGFFRKFTFISLLLGFPVILYATIFTTFYALSCLLLDIRISLVIASILCFSISVFLLGILYKDRAKIDEIKNVGEALKSWQWQERVAALKVAEQKGLKIADFHVYRDMLASPHIPERYWLARSLGASRKKETYKDLLLFLDDPHPNVVSMAFYALGRRGNKSAISEILKRIRLSSDWYSQWYAYKALRALGWKQTGLNSEF
jgi:hypothetical protein